MDSPVRLDNEYWQWHLLWTLYLPIMLPLLGVFAVLDSAGLGTAAALLIAVPAVAFFVGAVLSLYGYYKEAQQLDERGSDWVPTWPLYVVGHLILSPIVVAPIYLLQRWRHIGIPWQSLPLR